MELPKDILTRINKYFKTPEKVELVKSSLANLDVRADEIVRIIRCILALSESDVDALISWVKMANEDYINIIWYAEYDNRNDRKFNFNFSFNEQNENKMGE